MKKTITLLLLFVSLLGYSQNYEFIKTDGTYHFGNRNAYRIDSILSTNEGQELYSYRSIYVFENDYEGGVDPLTSWLGDYVLVDNDGGTNFYNWNDKPFVFHSHYPVDEEWNVYTYRNSSYLTARFLENKDWIEILPNLYDSVKYICLQQYDSNGTPNNDQSDIDTLRLSKNYGILDAFFFIGIDVDPYRYHWVYSLTGIDLQNVTYGNSYSYRDLMSGLEVGSQMHFLSYPEKNGSIAQISRTVVEKKLTENYCSYTFLDSIIQDEVFSTKNYSSKYYIAAMPYESFFQNDSLGFQGYIELFGAGVEDDGNGNRYLTYNYWDGDDGTFFDEYIWWVDYWQLNQGNHYVYHFTENVGELVTGKGNDWPGDELLYYKNSNDEWGTPISFPFLNVKELDLSTKLFTSPNPSNGEFIIRNNSSKTIREIKIHNINGSLVWLQEIQENERSLNLSFLPEGLYLLKMELEDHQMVNKRLIILK